MLLVKGFSGRACFLPAHRSFALAGSRASRQFVLARIRPELPAHQAEETRIDLVQRSRVVIARIPFCGQVAFFVRNFLVERFQRFDVRRILCERFITDFQRGIRLPDREHILVGDDVRRLISPFPKNKVRVSSPRLLPFWGMAFAGSSPTFRLEFRHFDFYKNGHG
jgi:hypothetical protein